MEITKTKNLLPGRMCQEKREGGQTIYFKNSEEEDILNKLPQGLAAIGCVFWCARVIYIYLLFETIKMLLLFSFACFFSSQHNSNRDCEFHTNSSAMRVRYILLSTNYAVINNWKIWSQLIRETQKVDFQSSAFETMLSEKWSKGKKLKTFSMLLVYGQPKNNIFKHLNINVIFNFWIMYILHTREINSNSLEAHCIVWPH